jgi:hypothetical protein
MISPLLLNSIRKLEAVLDGKYCQKEVYSEVCSTEVHNLWYTAIYNPETREIEYEMPSDKDGKQ